MNECVEKIDPADLLDRLMEDKDGKVRDAALARLRQIEQDLKGTLDGGVAPGEFEILKKVHSALEEASQVVEDAWALMSKIQKG